MKSIINWFGRLFNKQQQPDHIQSPEYDEMDIIEHNIDYIRGL